jgi:hypothetical protein
MIPLIRQGLLTILLFAWSASHLFAQTATTIPESEAAQHVGHHATVEGINVFTSKNGNTFLNFGAAYPNQTFTGWIPPPSPVSKSAMLSGIEGKRVKITGRIEMYKGKPEIRIRAKRCCGGCGQVILAFDATAVSPHRHRRRREQGF